jgi:hypothetical protein
MDRTVNNKFQTSPAIMYDGRSFTDYRPACYVDTMIANANRIHGSNDYREFLIHNGLNIMKVNDMYLENKMAHKVCNNSAKPGSDFARVCTMNDNKISCLDQNPANTGIYYQNGGSVQDELSGFDQYDSRFQSLQ